MCVGKKNWKNHGQIDQQRQENARIMACKEGV